MWSAQRKFVISFHDEKKSIANVEISCFFAFYPLALVSYGIDFNLGSASLFLEAHIPNCIFVVVHVSL